MKRIIAPLIWTSVAPLALALGAPAFAQPGTLDTTFGNGGIALVQVPSGPGNGAAKVLEQPNSEILAATDSGFMALLQSNGALDTTFGTEGIATFTVSGQTIGIVDLQLQSNGQIVVLGDIAQPNCTDCSHPKIMQHGVLARFNANGTLDTSFGTNGAVELTAPGSSSSDVPSALLIQPNGFILVADSPASSSSAVVIRFSGTGAMDPTFGSNGVAMVSDTENIVALGVQTDSKIVVIGGGQSSASRLLSNGTPDTSTAPGTVTVSTGSLAALQPNDDYVTVLPGAQTPGVSFQLGRFTLANAADNTFSSSQIAFTSGSTADTFSQNFALGLQPNGDVLAVGRLEVQTGNRRFATSFGVARVLSDGALDTSFGVDGIVTTSFAGNTAAATAVTVETSGAIVVGGVAVNSSGTEVLAVTRYLSE